MNRFSKFSIFFLIIISVFQFFYTRNLYMQVNELKEKLTQSDEKINKIGFAIAQISNKNEDSISELEQKVSDLGDTFCYSFNICNL